MLAQKIKYDQSQMPRIFLPGYTHPVSKKMHYWHLFTYYGLHSWEKIVIILLALNSLRQLYEGSQFITTDYKVLENHFSNHLADSAEVTEILNNAIAIMLDNILNLTMAVRLSFAQERVSRVIELIIGTVLVIWSREIISFLQTVDYTFIKQSATFLDLSRYF